MSLNQITNPLSTIDIQARSITIPDFGGTPVSLADNDGPVAFSADLTVPGVLASGTIRSHYIKYGKTYTITARIQFTTGASGTSPDLSFILNIPGFTFASNTEETAPITKRTGLPAYAGSYYDGVIQGIDGTNRLLVTLLDSTANPAIAATLTAAAANAYDLAFTMTAESA